VLLFEKFSHIEKGYVMRDIYSRFETTTLQNGLTVHHLHWPERAGVRFECIIHSGSRHDPVGKEGVAHFMEHLVSENAQVPYDELRRFFEQNAGESPRLGTTSLNGTYYGFLSSADPLLLAQALDYYGHMLLHATLEKEIERERQVILGEYASKFPIEFAFEINWRMRQAAFPNTPFGRFISGLGTKETIASLSQTDMQTFYDENYTPANMSIVSAGELTLVEVIAALQNSPFADNKSGSRTPALIPIAHPPLPTEAEWRFHEGEHFKGKESASFMSIAQLPGTLSSTQTWVVREMLAKELFKAVRLERAWTYHIGCEDIFSGDFSEFAIKCSSLEASAIDYIAEVVRDCIEALRDQPDSFAEAKQKLVAMKHFNDPSMAGVVKSARNELLYHGRIVTLTEELSEARDLQFEGIFPVLEFLSPERRWTAIGYP
jgi:predicted Zn-dependent peptidase